MKKYLMLAIAALIAAAPAALNGQAKKPKLMVIPSNATLNNMGCLSIQEVQGKKKQVPDYETAFLDQDLRVTINKIGGMFNERGFSLENLETALASKETEDGLDELMESSTSGDAIAKSAYDRALESLKPDIVISLDYKVNKIGPKRSITFDLTANDSYTNKTVAQASGTGNQSFTPETAVLLEEAVLSHIDAFTEQLQSHFDDLLENGREVKMAVRIWNGSPVNLEEEYDDEELGTIIDDWVSENTVNHRYSNDRATENFIQFSQVRIPLYDARNKPMDAAAFGKQLQKFLKKQPYGLTSKVSNRGLGNVVVVIGEK